MESRDRIHEAKDNVLQEEEKGARRLHISANSQILSPFDLLSSAPLVEGVVLPRLGLTCRQSLD